MVKLSVCSFGLQFISPTPLSLAQYIYISLEEMQAVANYINTKGRVAISELAAKSDTFIDMEVKASQVLVAAGAPVIDFDSLVVETPEAATA